MEKSNTASGESERVKESPVSITARGARSGGTTSKGKVSKGTDYTLAQVVALLRDAMEARVEEKDAGEDWDILREPYLSVGLATGGESHREAWLSQLQETSFALRFFHSHHRGGGYEYRIPLSYLGDNDTPYPWLVMVFKPSLEPLLPMENDASRELTVVVEEKLRYGRNLRPGNGGVDSHREGDVGAAVSLSTPRSISSTQVRTARLMNDMGKGTDLTRAMEAMEEESTPRGAASHGDEDSGGESHKRRSNADRDEYWELQDELRRAIQGICARHGSMTRVMDLLFEHGPVDASLFSSEQDSIDVLLSATTFSENYSKHL